MSGIVEDGVKCLFDPSESRLVVRASIHNPEWLTQGAQPKYLCDPGIIPSSRSHLRFTRHGEVTSTTSGIETDNLLLSGTTIDG